MAVFKIRWLAGWRSLLLLVMLCFAAGTASAERINVFAAASLQNVLADVADLWSENTGHRLVVVPAGSSALARQIQQGAPADVFISANVAWMDVLQRQGLVRADSRINLLKNRLVLISRDANTGAIRLTRDTDLAGMLAGERLAMALVDAVPAGIYGKAALNKLGLWRQVRQSVAQTDNVRAALALVNTGEAALGIVYRTDAQAGGARQIALFPANSHPPILYPAALVADSRSQAAGELLAFLQTAGARAIFTRHGFGAGD